VVEASDGSLVACCIAWFDPATGVAAIEPLGVVPEHRGRGLAGALCLAVATRVTDLGGLEVFINTGPRSEYPAPARAYAKVGFDRFSRGRSYDLT
jgi:predicted GNAT family acetyltransferase